MQICPGHSGSCNYTATEYRLSSHYKANLCLLKVPASLTRLFIQRNVKHIKRDEELKMHECQSKQKQAK